MHFYVRSGACSQLRVKPREESGSCYKGYPCLDDIMSPTESGDKNTFGFGEQAGNFIFWTADELGANPAGISSAAQISFKQYSNDGFPAFYMVASTQYAMNLMCKRRTDTHVPCTRA